MIDENHRRGKHWKVSIWVACLLLIVLASGSIFFIASLESSKGYGSPLATSRATPIPGKHATPPTATPTMTPTPALTPSPTQFLQPLFADYFSDNSKGWLTGNAAGYIRTINDNGLNLSATNRKILVESLPANGGFGDFQLTMMFTFKQGDKNDSVGLYVRGDSNLDYDYRIDIYGDNTYTINKESLDETNVQMLTALAPQVYTSTLKPIGQENTLSVIMKGPTLVLILNGRAVKTVTDPDYTRGQIALFVQNGYSSNGVLAAISNIEIYPAPDDVPGEGTPTPGPSPDTR